MRTKRLATTLAAFAVTSIFATAAVHAIGPPPGPKQESYIEYYSDATFTTVIGWRAIAHSSDCAPYHVDYGSTSSYSRLVVANCTGGIEN